MSASFVAIFLVTYSITALVVFTSVSQITRTTEAYTLTQIANQKLGQTSASLDALSTNLTAWSSLEVMTDIFSADIDKRIYRTLLKLRAQYSLSGQIYVFDAQGQFVASSSSSQESLALPDTWKPKSVDLHFVDKHLDPRVDRSLAVEETDSLVVLSHTIFANFGAKAPIGTIVAALPWQDIHKVIFEGDYPALLLKNGTSRILHSSDSFQNLDHMPSLVDKPLSIRLGNTNFICGYSDLHNNNIPGWTLVALKTETAANAPLWNVGLQLLLLGFALIIPVGFAIQWLSLMLTRPLHSLGQTVSDVARDNNLSLRAKVTTEDEIGLLAHAFNRMTENLGVASLEREEALKKMENLNATLERRVNERTAELSDANHEVVKAFDQLKSTQSQLVHSEKMASLGQLVAGVAHELNNPIGFIYANFPHLETYADEIFQLLDEIQAMDMPEVNKEALNKKISDYDIAFVKSDLGKIIASGKSGASRIKEIVSSLRSFSRLDEAELKKVKLEVGLDDTLSILNHYLKGGVTVEKAYGLNQAVTCRAGQINQVFTNIIFNAVQAMNEKGTLTITTRRSGDFAVVDIGDTGTGISEDILTRIFDPFFTTKKVGEGTGLGLSISYGIIENHGGKLEVESVAGKGTTFHIWLPIIAATPVKDTETASKKVEPHD